MRALIFAAFMVAAAVLADPTPTHAPPGDTISHATAVDVAAPAVAMDAQPEPMLNVSRILAIDPEGDALPLPTCEAAGSNPWLTPGGHLLRYSWRSTIADLNAGMPVDGAAIGSTSRDC